MVVEVWLFGIVVGLFATEVYLVAENKRFVFQRHVQECILSEQVRVQGLHVLFKFPHGPRVPVLNRLMYFRLGFVLPRLRIQHFQLVGQTGHGMELRRQRVVLPVVLLPILPIDPA